MVNAQPWKQRVWKEFYARNLTRTYRDVLLNLITFCGTGGACWPSHETLASRAKCSVRSVQRALQQARELGLVTWTERRVRAGLRWLRTSNLYQLLMPAHPVQPGLRPKRLVSHTTGQLVSGIKNKITRKAHQAELQAMLREAGTHVDLLAKRRETFMLQRQTKPR